MRARRTLLAAAVVAAPAIQVTTSALHPHLDRELLDVVAADPVSWAWMHLAAALAAMLYLLGLPALAALPRRRGAALATVGVVLACLGSLCLAVAFTAEAHLTPLLVESGLARSDALAVLAVEEGSTAMTLLGMGLPLAGIGQLLLAVGLLRSRVVAWWKPALVVVGLLASLAFPPGEVLGAALLGLAAVGYAALAVDVVRGPRPEPGADRTPVPVHESVRSEPPRPPGPAGGPVDHNSTRVAREAPRRACCPACRVPSWSARRRPATWHPGRLRLSRPRGR